MRVIWNWIKTLNILWDVEVWFEKEIFQPAENDDFDLVESSWSLRTEKSLDWEEQPQVSQRETRQPIIQAEEHSGHTEMRVWLWLRGRWEQFHSLPNSTGVMN